MKVIGGFGKAVKFIMTKLIPLAGYVLIEPLDEEETTASGLVMPEKEKEKPSKGRVVAVGSPIVHYGVPGEPTEPCPVKVDETVAYHRWSGQDLKEGQKEYKLVKFQDLMAIYKYG